MYDVMVIGGGSAGATLAARLSEDPSVSVVVLDAGPPFTGVEPADELSNVTFALTQRDWGLRARSLDDHTLDYPQGKAFGGGSSVNGALAMRGEPDDYAAWAHATDDTWSWEHMLRCFRRLEADQDVADEWHGLDGPIPVTRWRKDELVTLQRAFSEGCHDVGLDWAADLNRPGASGVGPLPMNRRGGIRVSTAIAYLEPAANRPNLTVIGNAHVHHLRVRDSRVVGADVAIDGALQHIDAGEVVVSAGAINTPALLLRSGIGPADELAALGITPIVDLPGVGRNLVDHPGVFLLLHPRDGVVDMTEPQFQLGVRCASKADGLAGDTMIGLMNFWDLSASPDFRDTVGADTVSALTCGLHTPRSRGSVTLASAEPTAAPVVDLNLLDDPHDVDVLVEGIRRCWSIAESAAMAAVIRSPALLGTEQIGDDDALRAYVRSMVAPWYHPCGTARLGADDDDSAVVDSTLAVRGLDGLRVVDASVLPTIPRAPTNLTVIAVAERAAELMRIDT